ncbi:MAG: hypothetical protein ACTHLD_06795 [Chitinophaga sp.]|jgi:hypothetical protein
MKTGLLFKLACLCIASVVLIAHFMRTYFKKARPVKLRSAH